MTCFSKRFFWCTFQSIGTARFTDLENLSEIVLVASLADV